jgi:hypothetical protein
MHASTRPQVDVWQNPVLYRSNPRRVGSGVYSLNYPGLDTGGPSLYVTSTPTSGRSKTEAATHHMVALAVSSARRYEHSKDVSYRLRG